MLQLNAPSAYPLLMGQHWLKTAHIKQNWQKNIITFCRGKTKVRVPTQEHASRTNQLIPLCVEAINMLDELVDEELDQYLLDNPWIVPLPKINVVEVVTLYNTDKDEEATEPNQEAIRELGQAQEAQKKELAVSQRIKASTLKEVNLGMSEEPESVSISKEM